MFVNSTAGLLRIATLLGLKGFAVGSCLFIAGSMVTTSAQFVPALLLASQQKDTKSSSSRSESGRLTPAATSASESKQMNLNPAAALKGSLDTSALSAGSGYKVAALQFSLMSKTAFATQVPFELLTIVASGFLAYHYRSSSLPASIWGKWAAMAGLMTAVFPLTGGMMVPIDHKIARIAGEEPPVEPYEDAPPDREMDRGNTENFIKQWGALNTIRAGLVAAAGGVGLWSLLE
ncbi:hypothetical protein B0A55_05619 [Friedmanniomyces simplex]|uniref:DUF1772-domain-containing protein n=1 Tax=Friedmanniomyces simplex TaxID=329884 RepID=A0A4U0XCX2_9PEZI|nr:hypothetical protein B0A55_05619 [Friedmanniomyces simplex]